MGEEAAALSYADLFAMTPAPLLVLTPDLVIVEANQAYVEAVSRPREELLGRYMFDLFPVPDDPDGYGMAQVKASLERARDTGRRDTMAFQRYETGLALMMRSCGMTTPLLLTLTVTLPAPVFPRKFVSASLKLYCFPESSSSLGTVTEEVVSG